MNRFFLAFLCFFRILFGKKLPSDVKRFLPQEPAPKEEKKALPPPPVEKEKEKPKVVAVAQHHRDGALALLALLQREGRLVDFLREALDGLSDSEIGAAARAVPR